MDRGAWLYSPWGFKELDMAEQLRHTHTHTHTHTSILVSFKKEVLLLATTWMNLEDNMVGEISPLQDKYCVTPLT